MACILHVSKFNSEIEAGGLGVKRLNFIRESDYKKNLQIGFCLHWKPGNIFTGSECMKRNVQYITYFKSEIRINLRMETDLGKCLHL